MKITSITITSKRHEIIGIALDSVKDQVDSFIFVDLGIDSKTKKAIIEHTSGKPIHFVKSSVRVGCGEWRNVGIAKAQELGFDWALQLDTDERMIWGDIDIHKEISMIDGVDALSVLHETGSYSKERFFKLPTIHKFHGSIHEYWDGDKIGLLPGVLFDERPKTEEDLDRNIPKQVLGLKRQLKKDRSNHRWAFYLAVFNRALGNHGAAIRWIKRCLSIGATEEAKAWDCYIASMCAVESCSPAEGLVWACRGLQHHPGLAELSFVAGMCCLKMGRPQEALCWANMAMSNGLTSGSSFAANRLGFREPFMLWEGPFCLQVDAMKAMGYPEENILQGIKEIEEVEKWRENARNCRIASPETDIKG